MAKKTNPTEYLKSLKDITLSETSRTRIEQSLLEYARFHNVSEEAVRNGDDSRSIKQVPSPTDWRTALFTLFKQPKSMTAAIIAIALIAGGGTSYAAQSAVPGDALYVVKTEVNENIKSALAVSHEAEARLQAELAEERLEEAETLAARGELSAQAATDISARVKAHADEAQARSAKAEASGDYQSAATVRANLEGSFRAYADILADLNSSVKSNNGATLIANIRSYADATANTQTTATATLDSDVSVKAAAKSMLTTADSLITQVETQLTKVQGELSAEAEARITTRYDQGVQAVADGQASFSAEAYTAAYTSAQTAVRSMSEVKTMISSALRVGVDGVLNTSVNTGVLDVNVGGGVDADAEATTDAQTETNSTETDSADDTNTDSGGDASVEVGIDATSSTGVDTNVIDAGVQTDTSVQSNTGLRL